MRTGRELLALLMALGAGLATWTLVRPGAVPAALLFDHPANVALEARVAIAAAIGLAVLLVGLLLLRRAAVSGPDDVIARSDGPERHRPVVDTSPMINFPDPTENDRSDPAPGLARVSPAASAPVITQSFATERVEAPAPRQPVATNIAHPIEAPAVHEPLATNIAQPTEAPAVHEPLATNIAQPVEAPAVHEPLATNIAQHVEGRSTSITAEVSDAAARDLTDRLARIEAALAALPAVIDRQLKRSPGVQAVKTMRSVQAVLRSPPTDPALLDALRELRAAMPVDTNAIAAAITRLEAQQRRIAEQLDLLGELVARLPERPVELPSYAAPPAADAQLELAALLARRPVRDPEVARRLAEVVEEIRREIDG